ncbi:asparagine synthase (glutamine-hydrolyzing) [Stenotrophomonas rhizophila]|uniref:asparagine synthase (glutamine-hydrolyzing) n=1 Tax=Stenotrophomonas rhizophila TaxID=216778 RepID=UPI001E37A5C7|nr:asparagine synthase (glutamine-hydrolyzing) [Stenotrophomonas rhizophila]MCC7634108.1 asparagine synthase (glutamine-hydrolyzing) [Stenotrophomonas rhizophila]MCC7662804.1 asparagine synthase (glutamine-hydrolyzing) [Stenotrophomonas rhizophila]
MSGLCGVVDRRGCAPALQAQAIQSMIQRLHRSASGGRHHWLDPASGVALAHCGTLRTSDAQPLASPCGRFVLVLDGSVCNRSDLRRALRLDPEHPACDAQLVLQAVVRWGLRRSLSRCRGAFALVLWDAQEGQLWLVRDRAGQRPLYYGWNAGMFLFGSELKAMFGHPRFHAGVDRDALTLLLRYGYIPAPHSILQGVFKLAPGHAVKLDAAALAAGAAVHRPEDAVCRYWCPRAEIETAKAEVEATACDLATATGQLDVLLRGAVVSAGPQRGRVATFLSGGTDSSVVAALAQSQSALPIDTFTLGFADPGHDERHWAAQVARQLGTRHTEHVMQGEEALAQVQRLPEVWCEPFADASQLPTLLASSLVARHVPVVLTGDGGDELFHGHASYARAVRNARWARQVPALLRRRLGAWQARDPERARLGGLAAVAAEATAQQVEGHYLLRVSRWRDPARVVRGGSEPATCFTDPTQWLRTGSDADRVRYLDFRMDLGDGVLAKVDRAGRAFGLDTRAPLLDLEVIRFAWSLPDELKYAGGMHKRVLKAVLRRHLPDALVDRPKRGFGPPLASWLAGPLRPWAEELLDPVRLQREGCFQVPIVRGMWQDFCAGQRKWHTHLWPILMFQAWYARYQAELASPPG